MRQGLVLDRPNITKKLRLIEARADRTALLVQFTVRRWLGSPIKWQQEVGSTRRNVKRDDLLLVAEGYEFERCMRLMGFE